MGADLSLALNKPEGKEEEKIPQGWLCLRCNNVINPEEKLCPVCTTTYLPLPVPQYPYYVPSYPPFSPYYPTITC